tara:strand:+ start:23774 stop:25369 length:1596 start_codon:yes stop_codon:yes gene_type:complete
MAEGFDIREIAEGTEAHTLNNTIDQPDLQPGSLPEETGQAALDMFSGFLSDTNDPNRSTKTLRSKIKTVRKMQADPTVSGGLQGYENILSVVKWEIERASKQKFEWHGSTDYSDKEADKTANFVRSCFDDLAGQSIEDIVSSAFDMLPVGFQLQAPQFKLRKGKKSTLADSSKYDDARIGWSFWKTLDQESVEKWLTPDGEGYAELTGIKQRRKKGGAELIPRNRLLLFRTTAKGDNPEGESILYGATKTWEDKEKVLDIELVSLSRNLEGIPHATIPSKYLSKNATEEDKELVRYIRKIVRSVKYNEQVGLVLPSDLYDESSEKLVDFKLLTAGGTSRIDACRSVAEAKEALIAEAILAMFLKVGSSGGGSYALSSDLTDLFVLAMRKYLDNIRRVINQEAIITLLEVNGMDIRYAPTLTYSGLEKDTVATFVDGIAKMIAAGAMVPTKHVQKDVMEKLDVSTEGADEAWDKFEKAQDDFIKSQTTPAEGDGKQRQENNSQAVIQKSVDKEVFAHGDRLFEYVDGKLVEV